MKALLKGAMGLVRGGGAGAGGAGRGRRIGGRSASREIRLERGAAVGPGIATWLGDRLGMGHDPRKCLSRLRTGPDRRRPGGALCRPLRSPERGRDRTRTARTKPEIPPIDVGVTIGA